MSKNYHQLQKAVELRKKKQLITTNKNANEK